MEKRMRGWLTTTLTGNMEDIMLLYVVCAYS